MIPIGFPLLPAPDAHGRLAWPEYEDSVRERLRCLLLTRPGELIGHPRCGIHLAGFLGRSDTLETRRAIHDRIAEQVSAYEPRVAVDRVEVFSSGDQPGGTPGRLRIEIHYVLRRSRTPAMLGLTLDLAG